MLEIEIKELVINTELKKKIEMICKFSNTKPIFINGSIRNIKGTNIGYVEAHQVIINNITYLRKLVVAKVFRTCEKRHHFI